MLAPLNCERCCQNHEPIHSTDLIVLTGGPGAGKTAVLEYARKLFCQHVAILPEAASMLFNGGFWRLDSVTAKKSAQRAIYHVQQEMQSLVINEQKWIVGLCDRGTLDGLAYWPNSDETFFENLKTNHEEEYVKYKAVIHLKSPSQMEGYNRRNPVRVETAEMAAKIDRRIEEAWKHHPHYSVVESQPSFFRKLSEAIDKISTYMPQGSLVKDEA